MTVPSEMVPLVQLLAPHFLGGGWESHPSVLGLDAAVPLRSPGSAPVLGSRAVWPAAWPGGGPASAGSMFHAFFPPPLWGL